MVTAVSRELHHLKLEQNDVDLDFPTSAYGTYKNNEIGTENILTGI